MRPLQEVVKQCKDRSLHISLIAISSMVKIEIAFVQVCIRMPPSMQCTQRHRPGLTGFGNLALTSGRNISVAMGRTFHSLSFLSTKLSHGALEGKVELSPRSCQHANDVKTLGAGSCLGCEQVYICRSPKNI